MYAVICSPQFWQEIERAINSKGEQILLKSIDTEIDISEELEKVSRISIKHLIIDISAISDNKKLIQSVMRYRIINDTTQIIIIAPNCLPGNEIIHSLVTMGIYDIIAPTGDNPEDIIILPSLIEVLEKPSPYKKAVRWVIDNDLLSSGQEGITTKNKNNSERDIASDRTVTITKEKIVGTIVISVAGTMNRIGTTHTAIAITQFLKNNSYRVALIELHKSENFRAIKNSYEDVKAQGNYFILDGTYYYPYSQELNLLDVLQNDFNYVVIDMGVYNNCNKEEFKRSNVRLIVSGVKDWELTELELILRTEDTIYKNRYYFNFSDTYTFEMVKSNMDQLKCYQAPYNPNPFSLNKECAYLFKELLKDVLPEIESTRVKKASSILSAATSILSKLKNDRGEVS